MTETWTADAGQTLSAEIMAKLQSTLEDDSPLIVEHRFYRAARAPHRFVSDSIERLERYIKAEARPGDSFYFWHYARSCTSETLVGQAGSRELIDLGRPVGWHAHKASGFYFETTKLHVSYANNGYHMWPVS